MTANQFYLLLAIAALIMGFITQASRAVFRSGKIMEKLDAMAKDIEEIKVEQIDTRKWIRDNAIRNPARR